MNTEGYLHRRLVARPPSPAGTTPVRRESVTLGQRLRSFPFGRRRKGHTVVPGPSRTAEANPPKREERPASTPAADPPASVSPSEPPAAPKATPPNKAPRAGYDPPKEPWRAWPLALHIVVLTAIVVLAIGLRLREPLSSPIMAAEDPYLHMERTWNLAQGKPMGEYPPGFMLLLLPFTFLGPDGFYNVVRFAAPFVGGAAVVAVYFLCRRYMHPVGSLGAGLLIATMPEHIFRTNALMPTSLDMVLVPVFFLGLLRSTEGHRWGTWLLATVSVALAFIHPWALGLMLVPVAIYVSVHLATRQPNRRWAAPVTAGGFAVTLTVIDQLQVWGPAKLITEAAFPRFIGLAANPGGFTDLPMHVNLPHMIGWFGLVLAGIGAFVAFRRRSKFGILALLWSLLLLPVILVDWFGVWYIPHRTVVYFSIGVAMLGGLALTEVVHFLNSARPDLGRRVPIACFGLVLLLMVPAAVATQPWYRVYDEDDFAAYEALEGEGKPYVMAGSWQGRAGYRAMTSAPAVFNPAFFQEPVVRDFELRQHPDLVVLVDSFTAENGLPTEFLETWTPIGEWGEVRAYAPPK